MFRRCVSVRVCACVHPGVSALRRAAPRFACGDLFAPLRRCCIVMHMYESAKWFSGILGARAHAPAACNAIAPHCTPLLAARSARPHGPKGVQDCVRDHYIITHV